MGKIGHALGTAAVWGGIVFLCHLFNSFNILSSEGAGWMVGTGIFLTLVI